MNYYIEAWAQGDYTDYKGKITSLVGGSFHAHYTNGSYGKYKFGNVCSAYCEFDYYTDGAISLEVGDMFKWLYDTDFKKDFSVLSGNGVTANDPNGDGNLAVSGMMVTDDGNGNLTVSNLIGVTDSGSGSLIVPDGGTTRTITGADTFFVVSTKAKKNSCHIIGYNAIYLLDVDYSERLKQIKSNFPMTVKALFEDVCTFCGCTGYGSTLGDFALEQVGYFYVDGITGRDVINSIAKALAYDIKTDSTPPAPKQIYGSREISSISRNQNWNDPDTYVICPGNGTYYQEDGTTPATNVWYKENSLDIKNGEEMYDGVEYIASNGTSLGHYYGSVSPKNIYYITDNVIIDNIVVSNMTHTFDYYAQELFDGSQFLPSLADIFPYVVATVDIFPFRCPFDQANLMTRLVDPDGTYYNLPIMSMDIADKRVRIESFGTEIGTSSADSKTSTTALAARVSKLEEMVAYLYNYLGV